MGAEEVEQIVERVQVELMEGDRDEIMRRRGVKGEKGSKVLMQQAYLVYSSGLEEGGEVGRQEWIQMI